MVAFEKCFSRSSLFSVFQKKEELHVNWISSRGKAELWRKLSNSGRSYQGFVWLCMYHQKHACGARYFLIVPFWGTLRRRISRVWSSHDWSFGQNTHSKGKFDQKSSHIRSVHKASAWPIANLCTVKLHTLFHPSVLYPPVLQSGIRCRSRKTDVTVMI